MNSMKSYPVIIDQDEAGKYIVTCPSFDGCYTQGNTFEETMENIREAIELCLKDEHDENNFRTVIVSNVVVDG